MEVQVSGIYSSVSARLWETGRIGGAQPIAGESVTSTLANHTASHFIHANDRREQLGVHCNGPVAAIDSDTMGRIAGAILSPLVFNRYPVSILTALLYGLVLVSVLFSDSLPRVKDSKYFDQAVTDLTKVRKGVVEQVAADHPDLRVVADHRPPSSLSIARQRPR